MFTTEVLADRRIEGAKFGERVFVAQPIACVTIRFLLRGGMLRFLNLVQ